MLMSQAIAVVMLNTTSEALTGTVRALGNVKIIPTPIVAAEFHRR